MEYKRVFNPEKGKWESIRVYTEEEVENIVNVTVNKFCTFFSDELKEKVAKEWFEQIIKETLEEVEIETVWKNENTSDFKTLRINQLFMKRKRIEQEIFEIDNSALINYELEQLNK